MTDENPAHSRVSRAREKFGLASSNSFEEKARLETQVSDAQIDRLDVVLDWIPMIEDR